MPAEHITTHCCIGKEVAAVYSWLLNYTLVCRLTWLPLLLLVKAITGKLLALLLLQWLVGL